MPMKPLPTPDERVQVTNNFAGIFAKQVCCVLDATNEEILAACNKEDKEVLARADLQPQTQTWKTVLRTKRDFESVGALEFWDRGRPVLCTDCPNRVHFLVSC